MINLGGFVWMTTREISTELGISHGTVCDRITGMHLPKLLDGRHTQYRALDVVPLFGMARCPVCFAPIKGRGDKVYCGKSCRNRAAQTMETEKYPLALGVPPIVVPVNGRMMREARRVALSIGLSVPAAIRYLINQGYEQGDWTAA